MPEESKDLCGLEVDEILENIADDTMDRIKVKNYDVGSVQNRWANVIRTFFESTGILNNRGAETMSNIDAIENIAKNEIGFLNLLQKIFPGTFRHHEQEAIESTGNKFANRDIDRKYIALVWGDVVNDAGMITGHIGRSLKNVLY